MSKPEILITDTTFIGPKHERMLRDAGYEIVRLPQVEPSEAELLKAIPGKVGYILGGTEVVTNRVLDAADKLKGIVFTGIDYSASFEDVPHAAKRNIMIGNVPNGPTHAVAEWAVSAALIMNRHLLDKGRFGDMGMVPVPGIENQHVGIIGYGHIGHEVAAMLQPFRPASISFHTRTPQDVDTIASPKPLNDLLASSDIVFQCIPGSNKNWLDTTKLAVMKPGSLLVSISAKGVIDLDALYAALSNKHIRAIVDERLEPRFESFPQSQLFYTRVESGYHTVSEIDFTSTLSVQNLLKLIS